MEKLASIKTRTSGGNENENELLVNDIITMFEKLEPSVSTECVKNQCQPKSPSPISRNL